MNYYQHGDVLIKKIKNIPSNAKKVKTNVLAEGESTGHAHRLSGENFEVYENNNRKYLRVIDGAIPLTHEEHKRIDITEGEYEVQTVREYDHIDEEAKAVVD